MLHILDFARDMSLLAVLVRLLTATVCGGLVGMERELKRRPAGFRTHILICIGGAMTILTNLYLYQVMHLYTDISRMGAQVIAGISFIGAGTIIVTRHRRVKGLTTAAGLWAVGIIGLACGAGDLELALFTTGMVLLAELLLVKLEYYFVKRVRGITLYVEYRQPAAVQDVMHTLQERGVTVNDLEISRVKTEGEQESRYTAVITVQGERKELDLTIIPAVAAMPDVYNIEEL